MNIKESIDQVRSQLPDEVVSKVGAVLENIKAEVQETEDRLNAANTESKNRKIKIREYESKIEDYDIKLTEMKTKVESFDDTPLKNQITQVTEKYNKLLNNQKQGFMSSYDQISKHPNFENAKTRFVIPEEKEGKLDWDSLETEALEKNLIALNDLNQLNYFAPPDGKFPNVNNAKGSPPSSVAEAYNQDMSECKTAQEIEAVTKKYWGKL